MIALLIVAFVAWVLLIAGLCVCFVTEEIRFALTVADIACDVVRFVAEEAATKPPPAAAPSPPTPGPGPG